MNDDIAKSLIKILPAVKSIGCEDDTTRLLNALRPFLSCEKQEKLDKAEKMLKLFKILPLLKDIIYFEKTQNFLLFNLICSIVSLTRTLGSALNVAVTFRNYDLANCCIKQL